MNLSTSGPCHNSPSPNASETARVDSRQFLLPTQVVGTTNTGLLPLYSLPLQMMNPNYTMGNGHNGNASQSSVAQNENHYASFSSACSSMHLPSQESPPPPTSRKEEPVDLDGVEIPLCFMQAYNYQAMSQNSLQSGCYQLNSQLQESNKEKASMNAEIGRLSNKCSQLQKERDDIQSLLAEERKESLKKQEELHDSNVNSDEMRKEAELRESKLQELIAVGNAKAIEIEELQENIKELKRKQEETDKELQEVKEINRQIIDEYFDSITKQTTINKLLSQQLAENPIDPTSHYQMSTILVKSIIERYQSQGKKLMIAGPSSSTTIGTVALRSKKRKHDNDSLDPDTDTGAGDKINKTSD